MTQIKPFRYKGIGLKEHEHQIFKLMFGAWSYHEIARKMKMNVGNVHRISVKILRITGCKNRDELAERIDEFLY